jgi:hypothetical protein
MFYPSVCVDAADLGFCFQAFFTDVSATSCDSDVIIVLM